MKFLELSDFTGCDNDCLIRCVSSGLYQGFLVLESSQAHEIASVLSSNGFASVVRESSKGFYVKINRETDRELWLPEEHLQDEAFVLKSRFIGQTEELGETLMSSILFELCSSCSKPQYLILMSDAVKLCCPGSPVLSILSEIESEGTEILVCRTSLDHFCLSGKIRCGKPSSVSDIIQIISKVRRVISL